MTVHMIFEVKLDAGFTHKERLVADVHNIDTPTSMTYASVASRDSVVIVLLIAALNVLDFQCADVQNAHLSANTKERVYFYNGEGFGKDWVELIVVVRVFYGFKGSGSAWTAAIQQVMRDLGFQTSMGDADVWMRSAVDTSAIESGDV